MAHTPTNWTNVSTLGDILQVANANTENWFWTAILYTFWFVALITLSNFGWEVGVMTASFLAILVGLILVYLNLIGWIWLLFFVGVLLVMFIYSVWSSDRH